MVKSGSQVNKFRMETEQFSVEVTAPNKREGKQLASQALLAVSTISSVVIKYSDRIVCFAQLKCPKIILFNFFHCVCVENSSPYK